MVPYSYTSIRPSELTSDVKFYNSKEIRRLDCVDLSDMDTIDTSELTKEYIHKYHRELMKDSYNVNKYMFNQFALLEPSDDDRFPLSYTVFTISDWNKADRFRGIDSRTITISYYWYKPDTDDLDFDISFKCKLEHLWQLREDIKTRLRYPEIFYQYMLTPGAAHSNLYVLPLYVCTSPANTRLYTRISSLFIEDEAETALDMLRDIKFIIDRFIAINYYTYEKMELDEDSEIVEKSLPPQDFSTVLENKTRPNVRRATSDKVVRLNISRKLNNYTRRINSKFGTSWVIMHSTQVRGHWKHIWVGSRKDKTFHKELRWIEPYTKGRNKGARIIKEYVD